MEASHVLLGRPWQYDKRAIHDGYTNCISFSQGGKKFILKPLTPKEVSEDQRRMRETRLGEWSDKRKSKDKSKGTTKTSSEKQKSVEEETQSKDSEGETQTKSNYFVRKNFLLRKSSCKENLFENNIANVFSSNPILQDLKEVCSKEAPHEMPKLKEIEDLIAKAVVIIEPISKPELQGKNFDNSSFNISELPLLNAENEPLNLRTNSLQEGGYDEDIKGLQRDSSKAHSRPQESKKSSIEIRSFGTKSRAHDLNLEDNTLFLKGKQPCEDPQKILIQNWKEPYKLRAPLQ